MSKIKISYWSDYACPFCYIGEKRMQNLLKELNLEDKFEFIFRCFELNPSASKNVESKTDERFAKKYMITIEQARNRIESINNLGKEEGIDFKYDSTLYTNTFDAHRLTKLIQSKGNYENTQKLIYLLYDAYFTKNLKLADRDVLINIGTQVGCTKEEIEKLLDNDDFGKEVRKDEEDGYIEGVHGVPYFIIGNQYIINGVEGKEIMKKKLINALNNEKENNNNFDGMKCGPDGCFIKK